MTSQSHNIVSPIPPVLDGLRKDIDWIDDQILDLLEQRYAVVKRVAWAKTRDAEPALAIRPSREARILNRLKARAIHVPTTDVEQVWRSILTLSAHHQRAYRVILVGSPAARNALTTVATTRYSAAVPIGWAEDRQSAMAAAGRGEAILIVSADDPERAELCGLDLIGQHATGCSDHPWALELGCLSRDEQPEEVWSPASWRRKVHQQLPAYPDQRLVGQVEQELASGAAIVSSDEIAELQTLLSDAQQGRSVVIQAGDCAESMAAGRDQVRAMAALIDELGNQLEQHRHMPAIRLGRLGGQLAKPRSRMADEHGLAAYRGDAVNGSDACPRERRPDARRLLLARDQSRRVREWLGGPGAALLQPRVHTSHEALLLGYESALTRSNRGKEWATSAHTLWLGDRTRHPDGAHVEYLRGIANPIGIKCGPTMTPRELEVLLDRLDPARTPGRIMLVARLGHALVEERLPLLMAAMQQAGRNVLWLCDPMHGNNRSANGTKVRLLPEVIAEVEGFARATRRAGVHAGGLHLEVTPAPVLECVERIEEATADRPFESLCDPRLNPAQARRVVAAFAGALEERS